MHIEDDGGELVDDTYFLKMHATSVHESSQDRKIQRLHDYIIYKYVQFNSNVERTRHESNIFLFCVFQNMNVTITSYFSFTCTTYASRHFLDDD